MRGAFTRTVIELAERDPRIVLLTADLGYLVLEPFAQKFPERFFNVGVAEQNMVGLATGLAESGFIPFLYSIVTFASLRPYEFIRNGPILHQLPVRIAGIGGGFEYGSAGVTHHGLEDVGVMRIQPGITVVAPADAQQTQCAIRSTWDRHGPVYYRLGKDDKTMVPGLDGRFDLGRVQIVREGTDLLFVVMGAIASDAVAAADKLSAQGISVKVAVVASVSPAPIDDLAGLLSAFPVAMTIEAHYLTGGVGSLVSEVAAGQGIACRVVRCGVNAMPVGKSGSQDYFHQIYGLSQDSLVGTAVQVLNSVGIS